MIRALTLLLCLATAAQAEDRTAYAFTQHPGAQLPFDTPLLDETGTPTTLRTLARNRPMLLILGYFHCPNLCGIVRDDVFSALARTTSDPSTYTTAVLSIDPAETPADAKTAKRAALDRYPPAATAAFLTGRTKPIEDAVGFHSRYDTAEAQFLHPAGLVVLTPSGAVSSYLLGVGYSPLHIERALQTAATGIVAAPADPILLLCFHYDPATGQYSLAITKLLRLAAALTALALVTTLALAHHPTNRDHPSDEDARLTEKASRSANRTP